MNKTELAGAVANLLRENNVRKPMRIPKRTFVISDEDGNSKEFVVKQQDKQVLYTKEDVRIIIDACIEIIKDNIKHGVETTMHGFGAFGVHLRAERSVKRPDTGEWVKVASRHVPKFTFGNELRMAAKVYDMSLAERKTDSEYTFVEEDEVN